MARFIQPQQQSIVPMYTPKNLDIYTGILDRAQGNLDKATAIKAAAIEKYGDLNMYNKEDRDLTLGRVQERLSTVLDDDFVSPSRVANTVMQTNQEVMPYVQALKAKDKEAQIQRQMRAQFGIDFIGNDVAQMSIADASGQAVDPSSMRGVSYNAEQFRKQFHDTYGANLMKKIEGELEASGRAGLLTAKTIEGLTEAQKRNLLTPGRPEAVRLATENYANLPEQVRADMAQLYGGEQGAIDYLQESNLKTAFDPKYNYSLSRQYVGDPSYTKTVESPQGNYGEYEGYAGKSYRSTREIPESVNKFDVDFTAKVRKIINSEKLGRGGMEDLIKGVPALGSMATKYPDLFERSKSFSGDLNKKANYFLDLVLGAEAGLIKSNSKAGALYTSTRWEAGNPDYDSGIARNLIANASTEIEGDGGKKTLGKIAEEGAIPMLEDNGDIILGTKKGNTYRWNVTDSKMLNSLNTQSQAIIQQQKHLYEQRWATTPDSKPYFTGVTSRIPGTNAVGYIEYSITPSNSEQPNTIIKRYIDPETGEYFYRGNIFKAKNR
jgi:hypothetical protein